MSKSNLHRRHVIAAALLCIPLTACITVETPTDPIEVNMDIAIRQEVLVRLEEEAEGLIEGNPEAFPTTETGTPQ